MLFKSREETGRLLLSEEGERKDTVSFKWQDKRWLLLIKSDAMMLLIHQRTLLLRLSHFNFLCFSRLLSLYLSITFYLIVNLNRVLLDIDFVTKVLTWGSLSCRGSSWLWCRERILLLRAYNHSRNTWDSLHAKIRPWLWGGISRRFLYCILSRLEEKRKKILVVLLMMTMTLLTLLPY